MKNQFLEENNHFSFSIKISSSCSMLNKPLITMWGFFVELPELSSNIGVWHGFTLLSFDNLLYVLLSGFSSLKSLFTHIWWRTEAIILKLLQKHVKLNQSQTITLSPTFWAYGITSSSGATYNEWDPSPYSWLSLGTQ